MPCDTPQDRLRYRLAASIALMVALLASLNVFASTGCSPFGGSIEDVIVDSSGSRVPSCDDSCGTDEMADGQIGTVASFRGLARHMRWPARWNERMLDFLRRHPLGTANDQDWRGGSRESAAARGD